MVKFAFFGSNEFSAIVLEKIIASRWKPVLVITNPAKPKGRDKMLSPTPVQLLAEKENIRCLTPESLKDEVFFNALKELDLELCVLSAYGKIVPKNILEIPKKGFINIHPSLLPRWCGASPIQSTILSGDKETGVTIILMDELIDHGPILAMKTLDLSNAKYSYIELSQKLANMGADLLIKILPDWIDGTLEITNQSSESANYCKKIATSDGQIDWFKKAEDIERLVLALNPEPGTYTYLNGSVFKILSVSILLDDSIIKIDSLKPGQIFETHDQKIAVKCFDSALLLETVQLSGKKPMTGVDFLRGHRDMLGSILPS